VPEPTFQNLGFEEAGAAPGLAESWTLAHLASVEELAGYGSPERPQEDFERGWSNDDFQSSLGPTAIEPALFDAAPESIEDFEEGWSQNEAFAYELASVEAADYDPGAGTKLVEDFDGLWAGNEAFLVAFAPGDLTGIPTEAFEAGWRGNESYLFYLGPSDVSAAAYDAAGTPEPVEDFEELWPALVMTTL
jgi:hypothetical protein